MTATRLYPQSRLRPRRRPVIVRTFLNCESLEERVVLDTRTFANLDFVAINAFSATTGGQVSVAGPVTVRRAGETTDLLKFSNGVSFLQTDSTATITAIGAVSAFAGAGTEVALLNGNDPKTFKAGDLLGTGATFDAKASQGVSVAVPNFVGASFNVSGIRIPAAPVAPIVNLMGSASVAALGGLSVPLPNNVFVAVDTNGVRLGGSFTASVSEKTFTKGNLNVTLNTAQVSYSTNGNQVSLSGSATIKLPKSDKSVNVTLGSPTAPGIQVTNGSLSRFDLLADVSPNNAVVVAGLSILPTALRVTYQEATSTAPEIVTVSGGATISLTGTNKSVTLAMGTAETDGIKFTNGSLTSVHATVSATELGFRNSLTFSNLSGSLDYQASSQTYTISGGGKITLPGADKSFDFALGDGANTPGLVITGDGVVNALDVQVTSTSSFGFRGLSFSPKSLAFHYDVDPTTQVTTVTFSGAAALEFQAAGQKNTIDVSLGSEGQPGVVVKTTNGTSTLESFRAVVSADFSILSLRVKVDELTFNYDRPRDQYTLDGQVKVSTSGTKNRIDDLSATLKGDTPDSHGLVIRNGSLQSLRLIVDGGFTLFGLSVAADGLTFKYDAGPQTLVISGGLSVKLTDKFAFNASITTGGLVVNTSTGEVSIDASNGLDLKGGLTLGNAFSADVSVHYAVSPSGVFQLSASGTVRLPQDVAVGGSFSINGGTLTSIGLSFEGSVQIGTTGVFLTRLSGSLQNLDQPENLIVSGSIGVSLGPKVLGHSVAEATGTFTITKDFLNIGADVKLVGGILGNGKGFVDINWSTGVYKIVIENIGLYDNTFTFSGDLIFDRTGNITVNAQANVNVPSSIPVIGGFNLASLSFYLQVRPQLSSDRTFGAAWTSTIFGTIGFQVDINGSVSVLTGPPSKDAVVGGFDNSSPTVVRYLRDFPVNDLTRDSDLNVVLTAPNFALGPSNDNFLDNDGRNSFAIELIDGSGNLLDHIDYEINSIPFPSSIRFSQLTDNPEERVINISNFLLTSRMSAAQLASIRTVRVLIFMDKTKIAGFAAPKIAFSENFLPPTITSATFTPLSNGNLRVSVEGRISNPDTSKTTISLSGTTFVPSNAPFTFRNGTLLQTFTLPANSISASGQYSFTVDATSFPDLAVNPFVPAFQNGYKLYVDVNDGYREPTFSNYTNFLLPPNPSAIISAPSFLEPVTLPNGSTGVSFSGPTSINVSQELSYLTSVSFSVDRGGGLTPELSLSPIPSFELNFPRRSSVGTNFFFVADSTYTGFSTVTVKARATTLSGQVYEQTKTIPIIRANAPLQTTVSIVSPTTAPALGDLVIARVQVSNPGGPNARTSPNTKVRVVLPDSLSVLQAVPDAGDVDMVTGLWTVGNLAAGQTLTMEVRGIYNARIPDAGRITVSATGDLPNFFPDRAQSSLLVLSQAGSNLQFDDSIVAPATGQDFAAIDLPPADVTIPYVFPLALKPGSLGSGGPFVFTLEQGSNVPPGMTLSQDGFLSGVPTAVGKYFFRIKVQDRLGHATTANFRLGVYEDSVVVNTPFFDVAFPSVQDVLVSGSFTSQSFFVVKGSLPPGINLTPPANEVTSPIFLQGTPTVPGFYTFQLQRDIFGGTGGTTLLNRARREYFFHVNPTPQGMGPNVIFGGSVGIGFSMTLTVPNPTPTLHFALTEGALPVGLNLTPDGVISGTFASMFGNSNPFTVVAYDAGGFVSSRVLNLTARAPISLFLAQTAIPAAAKFTHYFQQFSTTLADPTGITYSIDDGTLPPGLSLSSDGVLSGFPTEIGSFTFSVNARLSGLSGSRSYTIQVNPELVLSPGRLDPARFVQPITQSFTVSGGSGEGYSFAVTSGSLPTGLTLKQVLGAPGSAILDGIVSERGVRREFTITATDSLGASVSRTYVVPGITLPPAIIGKFYSTEIAANALLDQGDLPPGLAIVNTSGKQFIQGIPTAAGVFDFTLHTPSGQSREIYVKETLIVSPEITFLTEFPRGRSVFELSSALLVALLARGGSGQGYSFRLAFGTLPTGWSISPEGHLGGIMVSPGIFNFTIEAKDSLGNTALETREFVVNPAQGLDLSELPTTFRSGIPVTGRLKGLPVGPYTYAVVSGALPDGVSLSATTGELSGIPTTTSSVTVNLVRFSATDAQGRSFVSSTITLTTNGPVQFNPAPSMTEGFAGFSRTLVRPPSGFTITSVTTEGLPAFLTVSSTGRLSNNADLVAGTYPVTLIVNDSLGVTTRQAYTFVVNANPRIDDIRVATTQGRSATINVLNLATDPDNNALSLASFTNPTNGTARIEGNSIVITPNPSLTFGTVEVPFTITDPNGGTVSRKVIAEVFDLNNGPVAVADSAVTNVNAPITINVVANDTDFDDDPLYVLSATAPNRGLLAIKGNRIEYVPNAGFVGIDTFAYTVTDGDQTSTANVTVTVGNSEVSFDSPATMTISEGAAPTPLVLKRTGDLSAALVVTFEIVATSDSPAVIGGPDADVTVVTTTARFEPGQATVTINPFTLVNDTRVEPTKSFLVRLTGAGGLSLGAARSVTVTIQDNDVASEVSFDSSATMTVSEGAAPTPLVLKRTGDLSAALVVTFEVVAASNSPAVIGGPNADLNIITTTARFEPGQATIAITPFTLVNDTRVEGTKSFLVRLTGAGEANLGAARSVTVNVQDNDLPTLLGTQFLKKKRAVTSLVLTFNTPLNPLDVALFDFRSAGRDKKLGTKDDKVIPRTTQYTPGTNTLTFKFRKALAKGDRQQLRIPTSVRSQSGVAFAEVLRQFRS